MKNAQHEPPADFGTGRINDLMKRNADLDSLARFVEQNKTTLWRAAAHLSEWARTIHRSYVIGVPGHHRFGEFADDAEGRAHATEFRSMMDAATTLRRIHALIPRKVRRSSTTQP